MSAQSILAVTALVVTTLAACGDEIPVSPNGGPFPDEWVEDVTNPFFPLIPGTTFEYRSETEDGVEIDSVTVLVAHRTINGVSATAVHDRLYVDGELTEDTMDWYAQDEDGNVWYLGEDTKEYEGGVVVSTAGSFEWGVDGAQPGIIMWADPSAHVGEEYRQEYLLGEAEDKAKVVALNETVIVPFGTFTGCVKTEDWNPLEPSLPHENKFYCPNLGNTLETAPGERVELIGVSQSLTARSAASHPSAR